MLLAQALNKYRFVSQSPGNSGKLWSLCCSLNKRHGLRARPFKTRFLSGLVISLYLLKLGGGLV